MVSKESALCSLNHPRASAECWIPGNGHRSLDPVHGLVTQWLCLPTLPALDAFACSHASSNQRSIIASFVQSLGIARMDVQRKGGSMSQTLSQRVNETRSRRLHARSIEQEVFAVRMPWMIKRSRSASHEINADVMLPEGATVSDTQFSVAAPPIFCSHLQCPKPSGATTNLVC